MESKPDKIKVWYRAKDVCGEVDRALIDALAPVGYDCGDTGAYIGSLPEFLERDMEFIREGLAEYPEEESPSPKPGTVWLSCTLRDYEVDSLFEMIGIAMDAAVGMEYEEDMTFMLRSLKRKLESGMTRPEADE